MRCQRCGEAGVGRRVAERNEGPGVVGKVVFEDFVHDVAFNESAKNDEEIIIEIGGYGVILAA